MQISDSTWTRILLRACSVLLLVGVLSGILLADELSANRIQYLEIVSEVPSAVANDVLDAPSPSGRVMFVLRHRGGFGGPRVRVRLNGTDAFSRQRAGVLIYDLRGKLLGRIPTAIQGNKTHIDSILLDDHQGIGVIVNCTVGKHLETVHDDGDIPVIKSLGATSYLIKMGFVHSDFGANGAIDWEKTAHLIESSPIEIKIRGQTHFKSAGEEIDAPVSCEIQTISTEARLGGKLDLRLRLVNNGADAIGFDSQRIYGERSGGSTSYDALVKDSNGKIGVFFSSQPRINDYVTNVLPAGMFFEQRLSSSIPPWSEGHDYSLNPAFTSKPVGPQTIEAVWHYRLIPKEESPPAGEKAAPKEEESLWRVTPTAYGAAYIHKKPDRSRNTEKP